MVDLLMIDIPSKRHTCMRLKLILPKVEPNEFQYPRKTGEFYWIGWLLLTNGLLAIKC